MKITKRHLRRIVRNSLLESSRSGEAFDEGYSDATQERGLNPRRQGDMDYMEGFEMGEEDLQYEADRAKHDEEEYRNWEPKRPTPHDPYGRRR